MPDIRLLDSTLELDAITSPAGTEVVRVVTPGSEPPVSKKTTFDTLRTWIRNGVFIKASDTSDAIVEGATKLLLTASERARLSELGTSGTPQFASVNVGHASDSTLARSSAGILNVEGKDLAFQEPAINAQTGTTYTLALSDKGRIVTMSNADANVMTIPSNASAAFPLGAILNILQIGAGETTIEAASGVTLNGVSEGSGAIADRWQGVALTKIATDAWVASGAILEIS